MSIKATKITPQRDMPMGQPGPDASSLRLPSLVLLGCAKMTIKASHPILCGGTEWAGMQAVVKPPG